MCLKRDVKCPLASGNGSAVTTGEAWWKQVFNRHGCHELKGFQVCPIAVLAIKVCN